VDQIELEQLSVADNPADFANLKHIAGKYVGLGRGESR
jgi:hypothetical protein